MAKHSFALKMDRAFEHAETLNQQLRVFMERHPEPFVQKHRVEGDELILEIFFRERLKAEPGWSLLIGDSVHNLRSVLDHLVLDLGVAYNGGPLSEKVIKRSEFPIAGPRPLPSDAASAKIGHVHPEARTIIEGLQPHLKADYSKDPLWVLHELDNIDKHRLVHAVAVASHRAEISQLAGFRSFEWIGSSAEEPGPVARVRFDNQLEMKVSGFIGRAVAFADGPARGESVVATLKDLHNYVRREVVAPLSRFL